MKAQGEKSHLQAKEKGLRRHQPTNTMILDFQSPELWQINFCCLSHQICGILWWHSKEINIVVHSCLFYKQVLPGAEVKQHPQD
jgi:hypothetical protein